MSRIGASRGLTLTEELEKLEQSITLTLQEIDSNFSKAHRIVTTAILPIVEQYAQHSADVWQGSTFWKHFFEASANVSLSGYEEATHDDDDLTHTGTTSTELETPTDHNDYARSGAQQQQHHSTDQDEDDSEFNVDSPTQVTGLQTTPRITSSKKPANTKASNFRSPSPRKYTGKNPAALSDEPSTPRPQAKTAPQSSPFNPESAPYVPSAYRSRTTQDPLLHRILDKTYRVQATPHTQRRQRQPLDQQTQRTPATTSKPAPVLDNPADDTFPESSPLIPAPQLRSDLFSPAPPPRTPGVSILTPARAHAGGAGTTTRGPTTSTGRTLFSPADKTHTATKFASKYFTTSSDEDEDDSEFGGDGYGGISPPKTIQFHVPASRLLQTPAREASRRIVEDLLLTAGAEGTEEIEGLDDPSVVDEPSPSVVRRAMYEDDTF